MAELICPAGREYRVTNRQGSRLLVLDETDGFRFVFNLGPKHVSRGWRITGDGPMRDQQIRRDRSERRAKRKAVAR